MSPNVFVDHTDAIGFFSSDSEEEYEFLTVKNVQESLITTNENIVISYPGSDDFLPYSLTRIYLSDSRSEIER